jgi:transcriptional regulator with XRE-family HTH domain
MDWPLFCFHLGNTGVCILPGNITSQRAGNMESTIKLLDKYKKACSITSDLACAESLGVGRAAVSKWRNGGGHPEADSVEKMCNAINEPLRMWLPLIEAERAHSPAVRKVWLRLAQAAASIAAIYVFSRHGIDAHSAAAFMLSPYTLCEIVLILALAACAAIRNGGSKHAWILE